MWRQSGSKGLFTRNVYISLRNVNVNVKRLMAHFHQRRRIRIRIPGKEIRP